MLDQEVGYLRVAFFPGVNGQRFARELESSLAGIGDCRRLVMDLRQMYHERNAALEEVAAAHHEALLRLALAAEVDEPLHVGGDHAEPTPEIDAFGVESGHVTPSAVGW